MSTAHVTDYQSKEARREAYCDFIRIACAALDDERPCPTFPPAPVPKFEEDRP